MKVELRARPIAYFSITRRQLELMKSCAKAHYDGACQRTIDRAGAPIGNLTVKATENGILTMWGDCFPEQLIKLPTDTADVSATTRQIDLLCKVTEEWHPGYHGDEYEEILKIHQTFHKLIDLCNRAFATWKLEVEL